MYQLHATMGYIPYHLYRLSGTHQYIYVCSKHNKNQAKLLLKNVKVCLGADKKQKTPIWGAYKIDTIYCKSVI